MMWRLCRKLAQMFSEQCKITSNSDISLPALSVFKRVLFILGALTVLCALYIFVV